MKKYCPEPIDTSDVILSEDIKLLIEKISENVHDAWAKKRIEDGWVWGKERNDDLKTHPSLVPYEELSENEKDYDRITAAQTIRLLIKMGYSIEKQGM